MTTRNRRHFLLRQIAAGPSLDPSTGYVDDPEDYAADEADLAAQLDDLDDRAWMAGLESRTHRRDLLAKAGQ